MAANSCIMTIQWYKKNFYTNEILLKIHLFAKEISKQLNNFFIFVQDAHPKGEIFLGHSSEGFGVKVGVPPGARNQGFSFTLESQDRSYLLSAQNDEERTQWINVLQKVIEKPLTAHDATGIFYLQIITQKK